MDRKFSPWAEDNARVVQPSQVKLFNTPVVECNALHLIHMMSTQLYIKVLYEMEAIIDEECTYLLHMLVVTLSACIMQEAIACSLLVDRSLAGSSQLRFP